MNNISYEELFIIPSFVERNKRIRYIQKSKYVIKVEGTANFRYSFNNLRLKFRRIENLIFFPYFIKYRCNNKKLSKVDKFVAIPIPKRPKSKDVKV